MEFVQGVSTTTEERARRRPRRGMYVLPSLFTAGNIALGYYAILQSVQGSVAEQFHFDRAAVAIGVAILTDGADGRIARMTHTTSDFGRELDSLADVITFGVAPSMLAFLWGFHALPAFAAPLLRQRLLEFGAFACFVFLICGASRLARFNVTHNPQPRNPGRPDRKYFVGMPIPAGAGVIASVIHCFSGSPIDNGWIALVWSGLMLFTGFLMVSSWRFWSGKEVTLRGRHPVRILLMLVIAAALVALYSQYALIVIALSYLVSGVLARLAYARGRRRRRLMMSGPGLP